MIVSQHKEEIRPFSRTGCEGKTLRIMEIHNDREAIMEYFKLRNGCSMPAIGCGTVKFGRVDGDLAKPLNGDFSPVDAALEAGYRLFDTAYAYGNEEGIGERIALSGIPREELFLSSKVPNKPPFYESPATIRACVEESLRRMRTDYFDMMLIHQAVAGVAGVDNTAEMDVERVSMIWNTLVDLMHEGKLKGIGVSNFNKHQLEQLMAVSSEIPMVNQVRFNPASPNGEVVEFCKSHGIVPEAHSPLNFSAKRDVFVTDEEYKGRLNQIAADHGKGWAQVLLRYYFQLGMVSVPGSSKAGHLASNLDIFDFELSSA